MSKLFDLEERTFQFAKDVVFFCNGLRKILQLKNIYINLFDPRAPLGQIILKQMRL